MPDGVRHGLRADKAACIQLAEGVALGGGELCARDDRRFHPSRGHFPTWHLRVHSPAQGCERTVPLAPQALKDSLSVPQLLTGPRVGAHGIGVLGEHRVALRMVAGPDFVFGRPLGLLPSLTGVRGVFVRRARGRSPA